MGPPRGEYKFDLPPAAEQLEAIGMVAVEWSYLESIMDAAIGMLAQLPHVDVIDAVTVHLPFSARVNMLSTLFHLSCDSQDPIWPIEGEIASYRKAFDTKLKKVEKLAGERNAVVHSRWLRTVKGSPAMHAVQARGRLKKTTRVMPAAEIRAVAAQVAEAAQDLGNFLSVFHDDVLAGDA